MRLLGAEVVPVTAGSRTLKDAINEAMRDWVTNVATTNYIFGTVAGPHPFPAMVRDFQKIIGEEAREQVLDATGALPDAVAACVGGGSNAIGIFDAFLDDESVALYGFEAAGDGVDTPRHAATITKGRPGVLHGARSYLLQDEDGQTIESHSISAGLDYPGVGPEHAWLADIGRASYLPITDAAAMDALRLLSRTEGIIPAIESAHALAGVLELGVELGPRSDDPGEPQRPRRQGHGNRRALLRHPRRECVTVVTRHRASVASAIAARNTDAAGAFVAYLPVGFPDLADEHRRRRRGRRERRRHARTRPALLRSGDGRPGHPGGHRRGAGQRIPGAARLRGGRGDPRQGRRSGSADDLLEPGAAVRRRPSSPTELAAAGGAGLITPDLIPDEGAAWIAASSAPDSTGSSWPPRRPPTPDCAQAVVGEPRLRLRGLHHGHHRRPQPTSTPRHAPSSSRLRAAGATSTCVGLGISTAEQVREVLEYADGAIVGSALVRALADGGVAERRPHSERARARD